MAASKLASFGGMIPAVDQTLLPNMNAAYAENCWLQSGTLDGIRAARLLYTCANPAAQRVYRIPKNQADKDHIADSYWLEFENADTYVVESPVANDSFKRRYWAPDPAGPRYNTITRIAAGSTPYRLGTPYATVAPNVVATGGSSSTLVSRAYVFTWVSSMGEEGAPSPPKLVNGKSDDTWTVTLTPPAGADIVNRDITLVRVYRTITSSAGVATYFLLAELAASTTTWVDTITDTAASANSQLQSTGWTPPPDDMKGMLAMPNGMIVGWRGNELWFCEPYRPHAWPAAYTNSLDTKIVGCGVVGSSVIALTEKGAYIATGIHPSAIAVSKVEGAEACLSAGSVVETQDGVYYCSGSGISVITPGGAAIVSRALMTIEQWQTLFKVYNLKMARLGSSFYAFGGTSVNVFEATAFYMPAFEKVDAAGSRSGYLISTEDQRIAMSLLTDPEPSSSVFNDPWTSEVFVVRNGKVYNVDLANPIRTPYKWRSKKFQLAAAANLGAMKTFFVVPDGTPDLVAEVFGEQPTLGANQYGLVRIYADDRLVYTRELRASGEMFRLPSGFTADFYQIEIEARVVILSVQFAGSPRELKGV